MDGQLDVIENVTEVDQPQSDPLLLLEVHPIRVNGSTMSELPTDLYIPPDALEVFLETFEGPLDLLLYLIRKENIDILDIPIVKITQQFMEYVYVMKAIRLELAADYLVMAAVLAEIKSRMLLPREESEVEEELDPRAELVRRLQEYEQIRRAAEVLNEMPCQGRDFFDVQVTYTPILKAPVQPTVSMDEILDALRDVLKRCDLTASHFVSKEPLSVRERMGIILGKLSERNFVSFYEFFTYEEGRMGVVVTFLAMLELLKEGMIDFVQTQLYGQIHIKALECQT